MKRASIKKYRFIIFLMSLIMIITIITSMKQFMCRGKDITTLINRGMFTDIDNRITDKILLLESIGELNSIKDENIPLPKRALSLKPFQEKYNLLMIALMDKDGNTSSSLQGGLADLSDRDYFKRVKSTKQNLISDVLISRTTGDKTVLIVHPLLNENLDFKGAIFISLFLNDLIDLNNTFGNFGKRYSTNIFDENLNLITGDFDDTYVGLKGDFIKNEKEGVFFKMRDRDLHFIAFSKKNISRWYIVTDLNMSKYFLVTIFGFFSIIIIICILFFMILKKFDHTKQTEINPLIESLKKDRLTGIYNRHYLEETVDNYLNNKLSNKNGIFIILDVDNFKAINDKLGHSFGDTVIQETARKIESVFSENSIVARMGGDEFVIFIHEISDESKIIDKIKELLLVTNIIHTKNTTTVQSSISLGVTFIKNYSYSFAELYNEADNALYRAKKLGKNCAYISNDFVEKHIK